MRKVTLLRNGTSVILPIDSQFAEKNGECVELFEAARIFDDKTYIPARNLDELIGY